MHLFLAAPMVLPFVSMIKRLRCIPTIRSWGERTDWHNAVSKHVPGGGKLLSPPSAAGFLHWELFPEYRIYADLQMSCSMTDIYQLFSFYLNENSTARTIAQYQPEYISAKVDGKAFKEILEGRKEYVPVFAGDHQVLYVNKDLRPEVAENFQLKLVDPFNISIVKDGVELDDHIEELEKNVGHLS